MPLTTLVVARLLANGLFTRCQVIKYQNLPVFTTPLFRISEDTMITEIEQRKRDIRPRPRRVLVSRICGHLRNPFHRGPRVNAFRIPTPLRSIAKAQDLHFPHNWPVFAATGYTPTSTAQRWCEPVQLHTHVASGPRARSRGACVAC